MPWTVADVPKHNKSVKDADKPTWVKIANDTRARCIKKGGTETMCDALGIATANAAVKKLKEAVVEKETLDMRAIKEVAGMSVNDLLDKIRNALRDKIPSLPNQDGPWTKETYDDYIIYEHDGKLYQAAYTVSATGDVTLGAGQEVIEKVNYIPVVSEESGGSETVDLIEAEFETDFMPLEEKAISEEGVLPIKIIQPGWGASGYYSPGVIADAAPVYKAGTKMYWDHPTKTEARERPERSLRDLAAETIEDAHWESEGARGPGLYAKAKVFDAYKGAVEELADHIGLSHRAVGSRKLGEAEGRKGPIIEKIAAVQSVDFVTTPGAGGEIVQMFEAARGTPALDIDWGELTLDTLKRNRGDIVEALREEIKAAVYGDKKKLEEVKRMTEEEVKALEDAKTQVEAEKKQLEEDNATLMEEVTRLKEREILREAKDFAVSIVSKSELPDITKGRLSESLSRNPIVEDGKLDTEKYTEHINEAIKEEMEYVAKLTESGVVKGMGTSGGTDGKAQLKESFKRGYLREGHSEEEAERRAEIAATGR